MAETASSPVVRSNYQLADSLWASGGAIFLTGTQALVRLMHESGILPAGSLQLICGATGDLLDHLGGQDAAVAA